MEVFLNKIPSSDLKKIREFVLSGLLTSLMQWRRTLSTSSSGGWRRSLKTLAPVLGKMENITRLKRAIKTILGKIHLTRPCSRGWWGPAVRGARPVSGWTVPWSTRRTITSTGSRRNNKMYVSDPYKICLINVSFGISYFLLICF